MTAAGAAGGPAGRWARPVAAAGAGLAALAWLAAGVYQVDGGAGEVGVAVRFGRVVEERVPPGTHWNPAWPVGEVVVVKTAEPFTMSVGYKIADRVQNVRPRPEEMQWLTGDTNIVEIQATLQYVITDPAAFTFGSARPAGLALRTAAESVLTAVLGGMEVDRVLTSGQQAVLDRLRVEVNRRLVAYGLGIEVVAANFESVDPAEPVRTQFREVQNAEADRARKMNEARGYESALIPTARGEAQALVAEAEAAREARMLAARGEAQRFASVFEEYRHSPERTRERLYLETVEQVLPAVRVVVLDADGGEVGLRMLPGR